MNISSEKLSRLDDAFLFLTSTVGLLFTIIQVYLVGISGLLEISPFLFLGMVMPFYIGYVRGAISISSPVHSIVERMRGWSYLAVGVFTYMSLFLSRGDFPSEIGFLIYMSMVSLAGVFAYILQGWFIKVFKVGKELHHQYSFFGSMISAMLLAFASRVIIILFSEWSTKLSVLIINIWYFSCAIMGSIVFEKVSRSIVDAPLPFDQNEVEMRIKRNFMERLFLAFLDLIYVSIMADIMPSFFWAVGGIIAFISAFIIIEAPLLSNIYHLTSMVFLMLGTICFLMLEQIDFSKMAQRRKKIVQK